MVTGTTAAIVIDMQNGFCHPGGCFNRMGVNISHFNGVIPAVAGLLGALRDRDIPIIHTQQVYRELYPEAGIQLRDIYPKMIAERGFIEGEWDGDFVDELSPRPHELVIVKRRFDAFLWTDLELLLQRAGIERLVVAGVSTNVCVETTVRSAAMRDYEVLVCSDATAASTEELHEGALRAMRYAFAEVDTWQSIIDRIDQLAT